MLIIRASVKTEYYPVFWGVVYGFFIAAVSLVSNNSVVPALTDGAILSGVFLPALFLLVLSWLYGRAIAWWVALALGILIPFIVSDVFLNPRHQGLWRCEQHMSWNTSFQRTLTRGPFGPLNSDR